MPSQPANFQVRAEVAAAVGVAPAAGGGTFTYCGEAVAENGRTGHEAGEEAEDIVGTERVRALGDAVEEESGADAVAPEVVLVQLVGQRLGRNLAAGDVDVEDLAVVCGFVRH